MSLAQQLENDYITAYKAKDTVRIGTLRMLKTALKNYQVELMREPNDNEVFDVILKQCKQRQDSIEQFMSANRADLAAKEEAELVILREYMPKQLTENELSSAIDKIIKEIEPTSMREMGKVMQTLLATHKGQVDGKSASEAVKSALQKHFTS